ncbi:Hypothetical_protein [Hexamita inflata]|uniref:Hypothetical_protein n=1 Tax=Hexamita inflata TaxID=28002 RepID=A0AA86PLU6_9EUKA|nr:Hypothetical protein HINF_LOCUS27128 [Hexamita inflata]
MRKSGRRGRECGCLIAKGDRSAIGRLLVCCLTGLTRRPTKRTREEGNASSWRAHAWTLVCTAGRVQQSNAHVRWQAITPKNLSPSARSRRDLLSNGSGQNCATTPGSPPRVYGFAREASDESTYKWRQTSNVAFSRTYVIVFRNRKLVLKGSAKWLARKIQALQRRNLMGEPEMHIGARTRLSQFSGNYTRKSRCTVEIIC